MFSLLDLAQDKNTLGLRQLLEQFSDEDLDILEAALSERRDSDLVKEFSTVLPQGKILDRIGRVLDRVRQIEERERMAALERKRSRLMPTKEPTHVTG